MAWGPRWPPQCTPRGCSWKMQKRSTYGCRAISCLSSNTGVNSSCSAPCYISDSVLAIFSHFGNISPPLKNLSPTFSKLNKILVPRGSSDKCDLSWSGKERPGWCVWDWGGGDHMYLNAKGKAQKIYGKSGLSYPSALTLLPLTLPRSSLFFKHSPHTQPLTYTA